MDAEMARLSMPCEAVDQVGGLEELERRIGEALLSDESFNRKGGRDFLWLHSKGNMEIASGGSEVSLEEADEARRMDENEESGDGGGGVEKGAGSVLGQILDSGPMIATSERYRCRACTSIPYYILHRFIHVPSLLNLCALLISGAPTAFFSICLAPIPAPSFKLAFPRPGRGVLSSSRRTCRAKHWIALLQMKNWATRE
jgi:hypothetical protein